MAATEKFYGSGMDVIEFIQKDSDKDSQNCRTCKESVTTVVHDLEAAKSPLEFVVKDTASRDVPSSLSNVSSRSVCESTYSRAITNPCAKFPIFPNREYFCWLNAAVTLLIHSKSLKNYAEQFEHKNLKICSLITTYYQIFDDLNATTKVRSADIFLLSRLVDMQETAFAFLKFKQGCEKGKADSPIFAIRLFLEEFRHIPKMFEIEHFWMMYCQKCCPGGRQQTVPTSKTIIPFQNVQQFNPSAPITFSLCQTCGQKLRRCLQFKRRLPETCIYHFEKGGAHCNFSLYDFLNQGQRYVLKGFIQYTVVTEMNHFITWIRDPDRELWLCYNDLHPGYSTFSVKKPNIDPKEIHIMMWERVSDTDDVSEESIQIEAASPSKEMENALMLNRAESESSDERTPKRQCKDISQLPYISKQDIEQKSLQHSSNSVTPLSTILGETSYSGQLVKKRKEQDFAKDRPLQDMDCATTCPPIKQKKNASIEEVDMDDSSLERRPTVVYLRPLETPENKECVEHESMELDTQANMTKVMPENSLAKDISPNDSMKETVSTVVNSPLLQRCISPTPPVLEMSEDTRTENDEQCGSTSNIRETELNTNNNSAVAEPTQYSSSQSSDRTQQQKETPSDVVAVSFRDSVHAEPVPEFEIDEKEEFLGLFSQFVVSEHDKFIQQQISCGRLVIARSDFYIKTDSPTSQSVD